MRGIVNILRLAPNCPIHNCGARVLDAVTAAYAEKYITKDSQKWVIGFAEAERVATTVEFVPL